MAESSSQMPGGLRFDRYGEFATLFHDYWRTRWARVQQRFDKPDVQALVKQAGYSGKPFETIVAELCTADATFLAFLVAALQTSENQLDIALVKRVWERFRVAFTPALAAFDQLVHHAVPRNLLQAALRDAFAEFNRIGPDLDLAERAAEVSYASFTDDELQYLLTHHGLLFEAGCGTGYFLATFNAQGGKGIGVDDNSRRFGIASDGGMTPWTHALLRSRQRHLVDSRAAREHSSRTLGMFYAEPGTGMAYRTLEAYRLAGGQHFVWIPGGVFGGVYNDNGELQLRAEYSDSSLRLYLEIADHWQQVASPTAPGWNPFKMEGSMLVFKRRPTSN